MAYQAANNLHELEERDTTIQETTENAYRFLSNHNEEIGLNSGLT